MKHFFHAGIAVLVVMLIILTAAVLVSCEEILGSEDSENDATSDPQDDADGDDDDSEPTLPQYSITYPGGSGQVSGTAPVDSSTYMESWRVPILTQGDFQALLGGRGGDRRGAGGFLAVTLLD